MRIRAAVATAMFALGLTIGAFVAPQAARACTGSWPTFQEVRRTADAIYLGDIVWTKPGAQAGLPRTWFDLDVDRVVRGPVTDGVKVRGLRGHTCHDAIFATMGDRVILATGIDSYGQRLAAIWEVDGAGIVHTGADGTMKLSTVLASLSGTPDTSTVAPFLQWPRVDAQAFGLIGLFLAVLTWRLRRPFRRAA